MTALNKKNQKTAEKNKAKIFTIPFLLVLPVFLTSCMTNSANYPQTVINDIQLSSSHEEVILDNKAVLVMMKADAPQGTQPKVISLIDESTNRVLLKMRDNDGEVSYGWYAGAFWIQPQEKEETDYCYYAEFSDENGIHRSDPVQIHVTSLSK